MLPIFLAVCEHMTATAFSFSAYYLAFSCWQIELPSRFHFPLCRIAPSLRPLAVPVCQLGRSVAPWSLRAARYRTTNQTRPLVGVSAARSAHCKSPSRSCQAPCASARATAMHAPHHPRLQEPTAAGTRPSRIAIPRILRFPLPAIIPTQKRGHSALLWPIGTSPTPGRTWFGGLACRKLSKGGLSGSGQVGDNPYMPRTARAAVGGYFYHVLNRGNERAQAFHDADDHHGFVRLVRQACSRVQMRVVSYWLLPLHFHLVL